MTRTAKIILWLVVIVIIIAAVWYGVSRKPAPEPEARETIKIGAILPLTGVGAFSGEQTRDGMLIAVEEINEARGINGREIELLIEDSKTDAKEGVTAFNNLIDLKNPNMIVSSFSSVSMALVPLANEKEIPLLATIVTVPGLTQNDWTFRYYPIADQEIPPLVKVAGDLNINKIAVLYLNDEFGVSMFNTLETQFDGTVLGESFPIATGDFRTQITKLKSESPDAILVVGFSSHITNGIKQIRELGFGGAIFAPSTAAFPDVRKALNEIGVEVYAGVPKVYGEEISGEARVFREKFEERYNRDIDHYAATGYDLIKLIEQVIKSSGYAREEIKEGLTQLQAFRGIFGDVEISGREISFPLYPAKIENGEVWIIK